MSSLLVDSQSSSHPDAEPKPAGGWKGTRQAEKFYSTLWRWHFYAGLICAPILIVVALTGAIYTFREEIDEFRFAKIMRVEPVPSHAPLKDQCIAAQNASLGGNLTFVRVPGDPTLANSFSFQIGKDRTERVFVDPGSGLVTGKIDESEQRFWRTVLALHRRLGAGQAGRILVELATSWGLVLILTGMYLWWPRNGRGPWGVWLPRIRSGWPVFFRDLHIVLGIYASCFALITLFTGLFFTKYFRPYFSGMMERAGLYPEGTERPPVLSARVDEAGPFPIASMLEKLEGNPEITRPFTLFIPHTPEGERDPGRAFIARVGAVHDPSYRHGVYFDQYSGEKIKTIDQWRNMSLGRKLTYSAYPVHVGSIFGISTKLLAFFVCVSLVVLSMTGVVMWWLRRPKGRSGFVRKKEHYRISKPLVITICGLGLVFPVLGVSLLAIFAGEQIYRLVGRA